MTISYIGASTVSNGSGTTAGNLSLLKPTGTVANDLLIAFVYNEDDGVATVGAPSGWTQIGSTANDSTNSLQASAWYKVCGGSEPSSYTWTTTASAIWGVGVMNFRGSATSSPVDASASNSTTSSTSSTGPTATTAVEDWIIGFHASRALSASSTTSSTANPWTEGGDWGNTGGSTVRNGAMYYYTAGDVAPGTNGGLTVTMSQAVVGGLNFLVAIKESMTLISASDTFHGTDAAGNLRPDSADTVVGLDTATVKAVVPAVDASAAAVESGRSQVPINAADTGTAIDTAIVVAHVGDTDSATAAEGLTIGDAGATLAFGTDAFHENSSATAALAGVQQDAGVFNESAVLAVEGYLAPGQRIIRVLP